jgi:hypothetical protein
VPRPETGQVERAVAGLTISVLKGQKKAEEARLAEGLAETEEQLKLEISGRAEEFPIWTDLRIKFGTVFLAAPGQRDSEYDRPHFSYGYEVTEGGPVGLDACVTEWLVNDREETVGCKLAVGPRATDYGTRFRGLIHARFQGYGAPVDVYGNMGEQMDID